MADAGGPKTGKKLILGIAIGLVVAGGGSAGTFLFLGKQSMTNPAQKKPEEPGPVEKLAPFIVNLRDPGAANRYLKATLELELGSDKDVEKVKKFTAKIRHEVLMFLSNLTVKDVEGLRGKQAVVSNLLERIRAAYTAGEVKRLYVTEFIVQ